MINDNIFEFLQIYLNSIAVVGLIFLIFMFVRQQRKREINEQKRTAHKFIIRWSSFDIQSAYSNATSDGKFRLEEKNFTTERVEAIVLVLNFFEELALAVESEFVDEESVKSYLKSPLKLAFENLQDYLEVARKLEGSSKVFAGVERLYGRWVFEG